MEKIYSKNTKKFKSILINVIYVMPYEKANFSKNALLAEVMSKSCNKYKTTKELELKKAELFSTQIDVEVEKYRNGLALKFELEVINGKCVNISNADNLKEAVNLFYEIIERPNVVDASFDEQLVEREKKTAIQKIYEEKDNKKKYALSKLEQYMFAKKEYACSLQGTEGEIAIQNGHTLYEYYMQVINEAEIFVEVVGNQQGYENLAHEIYNKLVNADKMANVVHQNNQVIDISKKDVEYFEEIQDINQSILTIGLKVGNQYSNDVILPQLYAHILGGTPSSKLFQNVREKNSLAYFAKAIYNKQQQSIYIFSGIAPENYNKAREVVEQQVEIIKQGEISDIEFEAAKTSLISLYQEADDDKNQIAKIICANNMVESEYTSIASIILAIKEITKEQIIDMAKYIYETTVFLLGGTTDGK